ncbi:hypothetical protein PtB15_12B125 [Puccinia triticina]|nr:hypothetical protein PtB15_12B125 [Puccinia triticina]
MRAALYSTLSAYRTFNSLILVLLGLIIAQCLCFPTLGEILETHPDDLPEFAKRVKLKMWQNSCSSIEELGRSICGERVGSHGGQSHNHKGPDANANTVASNPANVAFFFIALAALFLSALQNDVLNPIQISSAPQSIRFEEKVAKELYDAISNLSELVKSLMGKVSKSADQPPDLGESAGTGLFGNAEHGELVALDFLKGTKKVVKILEASIRSTRFPPDQQILAAVRERMALDHINEALVKFLIIIERHNLASPEWLENVLNKQQGVEIIFNYLAQSPFTAELQGLFTYFGFLGWHWLERLHLMNQLSAFDGRFGDVATNFWYYTLPYFLKEDANQKLQEKNIKKLLSELMKQISDISKSSGKISISSPPIMEILSLKVLHSMVRFLGRYHIRLWVNEEGRRIRKDVKRFRELDNIIMLFSDLIKSVYFQYGQSMQKIIPFWNLDDSIAMIYLSDINKSAQPVTVELVAEKIAPYHKYPQLPYFQPMINNIFKGLSDTQNHEARRRLDGLKLIFLNPEKIYTAT